LTPSSSPSTTTPTKNRTQQHKPTNTSPPPPRVKLAADQSNLKTWALNLDDHNEPTTDDTTAAAIRESRALWLKTLDQVRDFRWRHWCFAREYILKRTTHPTATGGSPIVTWLPNQLSAVMDEMVSLYEAVGGGGGGLGEEVAGIMDLVGRQREMLRKEVRKFCEERGVKEAGV
jgi:indoleamine 2,3-dioxygenase